MEKYAKNESEKKIIRHIMATAPNELGKRIKIQNFGKSNYRSREVSEAMTVLDMARVIQVIYPTTSQQFPLQPDLKKSPKLQFLDTGIVNYSSGLQVELIGTTDLLDNYRGAMVEHLVF